ncbi:MAG TPA: VCBS repeat-containing protein, partial [Anaerolineae bacterium]|nr:VCBS repeat-containing protein [Anaerolineae bacterium]
MTGINPKNQAHNSRPITESTLKRTRIMRSIPPVVLQHVSRFRRRIPFGGATHYVSCLHIFTILALLLLPLLLPHNAAAQTQPQSYWQYAAPRRIDHVVVSDVNRDGVDEFILAMETGQVDLLSSDGILQWSYMDTSGAPAQALTALNGNRPEQTIALVIGSQLILLDGRGDVLWQTRFQTTDPPPALLTAGGIESQAEWEEKYQPQVLQIEPFDYDDDGRDEILILFNTGQLLLYDGSGNELWRNNDAFIIPAAGVRPQLAAGDLNRDGRPEIALGYFNPRLRYSVLSLLGSDGLPLWSQNQPISGRITAVSLIPFSSDGQLQIAVGTDRGNIHLYEANRRRAWWPRTLNVPITTLAAAHLPEGTALLAGTDSGSIMAYSATGRRF